MLNAILLAIYYLLPNISLEREVYGLEKITWPTIHFRNVSCMQLPFVSMAPVLRFNLHYIPILLCVLRSFSEVLIKESMKSLLVLSDGLIQRLTSRDHMTKETWIQLHSFVSFDAVIQKHSLFLNLCWSLVQTTSRAVVPVCYFAVTNFTSLLIAHTFYKCLFVERKVAFLWAWQASPQFDDVWRFCLPLTKHELLFVCVFAINWVERDNWY